MSAHIRMALTAVSLTIPVMRGRAALGVWQAVYFTYEYTGISHGTKRVAAYHRRIRVYEI